MTQTTEKPDYKSTLNLPTTAFAMKADLVKSEPIRLGKWQTMGLYDRVLEARANAPLWTLHDGPPFANGDIHIGHVINKTLKDIVMRFKTMTGHRVPYVPGWDCHGLPIEHKIQEQLGSKWREMSAIDIRKKCYDYAQSFVEKQAEQFQRLGILGGWSNPYRTMAPEYESRVLEVFARIVEKGLVYQQLKPVNWSIENQTALAEADLEYKDVTDTSVYVEFAVANPGEIKGRFDLRANARVSFLIWTTTPWTLPANLAITAGPEVEYSFVQFEREGQSFINIIATDLVAKAMSKIGAEHQVLATATGKQLEGVKYQHPFMDRLGTLVLGDYVTTTDGTGLVHTAPGHGDEDYQTGKAYGLDVYCPVLGNGRYDDTVPGWLRGLTVWQANPVIVEKLKELGMLYKAESYLHSYPHDARSKKPTIYRATEQWFVSVDQPFGDEQQSIRERALQAIETDVEFFPEWGKARLKGMLESRPDWVLSRQRAWGLPMPIFVNQAGTVLLDPNVIRAISKQFAEHGSNAWFEKTAAELLAGIDLPEGFEPHQLRRGNDTFDVWFESGNSWFAVVEGRSETLGHVPVDLYLEGSDQHRGWFQLSMLPAIAVTGKPPYKKLLTHGFAVKPDGTKVSKSDKEYVKALDEINRHGADVLRLWVASCDYEGDLRVAPATLAEFGDKYRKIRNTIRYLLSNISDLPPGEAKPPRAASLDGWMLSETATLVKHVREAYESYRFHIVFKLLHDFCNVQVSAIYANAMKDRLYCDSPDSENRRSAQRVMRVAAEALIKLLAPLCVFTADEAWESLVGEGNVHLTMFPESIETPTSNAWPLMMRLRDEGNTAITELVKKLRTESGVGEKEKFNYKTLDAELVIHCDAATRAKLEPFGVDLEDMVGAGCHSFVESSDEVHVEAIDRKGTYDACARSWKRRPDVGTDAAYPDLCLRDAKAVAAARKA